MESWVPAAEIRAAGPLSLGDGRGLGSRARARAIAVAGCIDSVGVVGDLKSEICCLDDSERSNVASAQ